MELPEETFFASPPSSPWVLDFFRPYVGPEETFFRLSAVFGRRLR